MQINPETPVTMPTPSETKITKENFNFKKFPYIKICKQCEVPYVELEVIHCHFTKHKCIENGLPEVLVNAFLTTVTEKGSEYFEWAWKMRWNNLVLGSHAIIAMPQVHEYVGEIDRFGLLEDMKPYQPPKLPVRQWVLLFLPLTSGPLFLTVRDPFNPDERMNWKVLLTNDEMNTAMQIGIPQIKEIVHFGEVTKFHGRSIFVKASRRIFIFVCPEFEGNEEKLLELIVYKGGTITGRTTKLPSDSFYLKKWFTAFQMTPAAYAKRQNIYKSNLKLPIKKRYSGLLTILPSKFSIKLCKLFMDKLRLKDKELIRTGYETTELWRTKIRSALATDKLIVECFFEDAELKDHVQEDSDISLAEFGMLINTTVRQIVFREV